MKILIVTHGFPPAERGGTELYSYSLAKALNEKGHKVSVFTRFMKPLKGKLPPDGVVREDFEGLSVLRSPDGSNSLREFLNPYISKAFKRIILEERPDIIHFQHLIFLSADLPEIAAVNDVPSVMTLHDYWYICPKVQLLNNENARCAGPMDGAQCAFCFDPPSFNEHRLVNRLKGFVPRQAKEIAKQLKQDIENHKVSSAIKALEFNFRLNFLKRQFKLFKYRISPSQYLIGKYEREGFTDISYIPLAFPTIPRVDSVPSDVLSLGYMGNISYPKGLAVVMRELAELLMEKKVKLHVYGRPYDHVYFRKIEREGAGVKTGMVRFHGGYANTREDLVRILASFDALIFPSVWEENAPVVVREALSAGKPVIASRLGGLPEIVQDRVNGLLFDPFKSGDLLSKTREILENPQLLRDLTRGTLTTKSSTLDEHADKIISLYEEALKE